MPSYTCTCGNASIFGNNLTDSAEGFVPGESIAACEECLAIHVYGYNKQFHPIKKEEHHNLMTRNPVAYLEMRLFIAAEKARKAAKT